MNLDIATARCFVPLLATSAPDGRPTRYLAAHGGRASAKSHFFAELLVEENLRMKVDSVCIREVQKSLRFSVKRTIESKINALNAGAYFSIQDKMITSSRGGITIFEGMQNQTAESIKSLEGFDRAFVEEAQTFSQKSLDMLDPTIRKPGSQIWFGWNPRFKTDPVDAFFRGQHLPPGAIVVQANYRDNPWFPDVLRPKVEFDMQHDKDKYEHVWMGGYEQHSEARVFKRWEVAEFDTPSNATLRLGADWGFSVDPSVLVRCFIGRFENGVAIADDRGRHLFVDAEAYEIGCEIDKTPELFDTVPESRKWVITADSARPETISYMRNHGFPKLTKAIKGPGSIEDGVTFLQGYTIVVHPQCVNTIDEMVAYKYKTDPLTGKVLPTLEDKKNNVIDALRYACEGARRAIAVLPVRHEAPVPMSTPFSRSSR